MERLYDAVTALMDCDVGKVSEAEVDELALRLDALDRMLTMATDLRAAVELKLVEVMAEDTQTIAEVGTLVRYPKKGRRQKEGGNERFRQDIAVKAAIAVGVDDFTGEVDDDRRKAALEGAKQVTRWANFYPANLSAAGKTVLDPDDYTEETEVKVVKVIPFGEEPYRGTND